MKKTIRFLNKDDGSLSKKLLRSTTWVGVTSVITNLLILIRGIILARLLTPEIFGLMSICLVVIRGVEIFTETGFYTALIQRQKDYEEAKDTAFTLMILRGIILAVITVLISPFVANYYKQEILNVALKVIAISFIFSGFNNVNMVSLQKELNFRRLSYLDQAKGILNVVIVIILAYSFRSVWALVLGHVIACLLGSILSFVIIPGRPRIRFNANIAKELFSYGKFITGISVVVFITTEIDNIIIGKILGMEALGYYVLAYALANLPATHISKVISRVVFPAYSKLQDNLPALQKVFLSVLRLVSVISIPAAAGLAVLAPEIVRIIYGEKWLPAVDALIILSIFGCVRSLGSLNGYLYNAIGKPKISFYFNLTKLLLILVIIFPLSDKYGIIGASIAVTVPSIIQYILEIYVLGGVIKLKYFRLIGVLITPSIYTAIMCTVIIFFKKNISFINISELAFLIGGGILTYSVLNLREILSHLRKVKSLIQS